MAFFEDMAKMTRDMLKPDSQGGLGHGVVNLLKVTAGSNPNNPWEHAPAEKEPVKAAVKGIESKLIGTEYGSTVLLASDKDVVTEVPKKNYTSVDSMEIDGVVHNIISVRPIPAAGTPSAFKFIVRE